MEINIRQETPADYDAVYRLVKEAFATADHSDGDEQDLVVRLRKSEAFIPELSLVAEADGVLAGYILLTKIRVGEETELAAAPSPARRLSSGKGSAAPLSGRWNGLPGSWDTGISSSSAAPPITAASATARRQNTASIRLSRWSRNILWPGRFCLGRKSWTAPSGMRRNLESDKVYTRLICRKTGLAET